MTTDENNENALASNDVSAKEELHSAFSDSSDEEDSSDDSDAEDPSSEDDSVPIDETEHTGYEHEPEGQEVTGDNLNGPQPGNSQEIFETSSESAELNSAQRQDGDFVDYDYVNMRFFLKPAILEDGEIRKPGEDRQHSQYRKKPKFVRGRDHRPSISSPLVDWPSSNRQTADANLRVPIPETTPRSDASSPLDRELNSVQRDHIDSGKSRRKGALEIAVAQFEAKRRRWDDDDADEEFYACARSATSSPVDQADNYGEENAFGGESLSRSEVSGDEIDDIEPSEILPKVLSVDSQTEEGFTIPELAPTAITGRDRLSVEPFLETRDVAQQVERYGPAENVETETRDESTPGADSIVSPSRVSQHETGSETWDEDPAQTPPQSSGLSESDDTTERIPHAGDRQEPQRKSSLDELEDATGMSHAEGIASAADCLKPSTRCEPKSDARSHLRLKRAKLAHQKENKSQDRFYKSTLPKDPEYHMIATNMAHKYRAEREDLRQALAEALQQEYTLKQQADILRNCWKSAEKMCRDIQQERGETIDGLREDFALEFRDLEASYQKLGEDYDELEAKLRLAVKNINYQKGLAEMRKPAYLKEQDRLKAQQAKTEMLERGEEVDEQRSVATQTDLDLVVVVSNKDSQATIARAMDENNEVNQTTEISQSDQSPHQSFLNITPEQHLPHSQNQPTSLSRNSDDMTQHSNKMETQDVSTETDPYLDAFGRSRLDNARLLRFGNPVRWPQHILAKLAAETARWVNSTHVAEHGRPRDLICSTHEIETLLGEGRTPFPAILDYLKQRGFYYRSDRLAQHLEEWLPSSQINLGILEVMFTARHCGESDTPVQDALQEIHRMKEHLKNAQASVARLQNAAQDASQQPSVDAHMDQTQTLLAENAEREQEILELKQEIEQHEEVLQSYSEAYETKTVSAGEDLAELLEQSTVHGQRLQAENKSLQSDLDQALAKIRILEEEASSSYATSDFTESAEREELLLQALELLKASETEDDMLRESVRRLLEEKQKLEEQVKNLQDRVNDLEEFRLNANFRQTSNDQTDLKACQEYASRLETEKAELQARIDELQQQLNNLRSHSDNETQELAQKLTATDAENALLEIRIEELRHQLQGESLLKEHSETYVAQLAEEHQENLERESQQHAEEVQSIIDRKDEEIRSMFVHARSLAEQITGVPRQAVPRTPRLLDSRDQGERYFVGLRAQQNTETPATPLKPSLPKRWADREDELFVTDEWRHRFNVEQKRSQVNRAYDKEMEKLKWEAYSIITGKKQLEYMAPQERRLFWNKIVTAPA